MSKKTVDQYMDEGNYLPDILKDFHDQKNLFKCMHCKYESTDNENRFPEAPNWRDGQIYTIDWFLWYMARRGYKLQKCRAEVEWEEFENFRDIVDNFIGDNQKEKQ